MERRLSCDAPVVAQRGDPVLASGLGGRQPGCTSLTKYYQCKFAVRFQKATFPEGFLAYYLFWTQPIDKRWVCWGRSLLSTRTHTDRWQHKRFCIPVETLIVLVTWASITTNQPGSPLRVCGYKLWIYTFIPDKFTRQLSFKAHYTCIYNSMERKLNLGGKCAPSSNAKVPTDLPTSLYRACHANLFLLLLIH